MLRCYLKLIIKINCLYLVMDISQEKKSNIKKELQEYGFEIEYIELALRMAMDKEEAINL
jgi:hypothetical protein